MQQNYSLRIIERVQNGFKALALHSLRAYKGLVSPILPPACRYVPTCSEYAMEAVDRYGVLRGGVMAAWRLLRCHPFVRGGYDPVVRKESIGTPGLPEERLELNG